MLIERITNSYHVVPFLHQPTKKIKIQYLSNCMFVKLCCFGSKQLHLFFFLVGKQLHLLKLEGMLFSCTFASKNQKPKI